MNHTNINSKNIVNNVNIFNGSVAMNSNFKNTIGNDEHYSYAYDSDEMWFLSIVLGV